MNTSANGIAIDHLPSAVDSECQVVGSCLIDPAQLSLIVDETRPSDYIDPAHQATIRTLVSMHREGTPIDVLTVRQQLADLPSFPGDVTVYLAEVGRECVTAAHAGYHANLVAETARKRRLLLLATDTAAAASNGQASGEILGSLLAEAKAMQHEADRQAASSADVFERWAASVRNREKPQTFTCASYGSWLNKIPIAAGMVTMFGAIPGLGKTALAMQLFVDALQLNDGIRALVANCEMSPHTLLNRQLARLARVGHSWIAHRDWDENAQLRVDDALELLRTLMPRLEFMTPPFTLERLADRAESSDAQLVCIDYAQRFDLAHRSSDQRAQASAVMDAARRIADQGRAVIVVSAVNRQGYNRENAGLASFRESSELEYGCDAAYLLLQDEQNRDAVTLKNVKNRNAQLENIELVFDGSRQCFSNNQASIEWTAT